MFWQLLHFEILNPTEFEVFESLTLRSENRVLIWQKNRVLKSLTLRDFAILGR